MDTALLICRLLLAAVFALAGATKLYDLSGSRQALLQFGLPTALAHIGAVVLPLAELAVAATLLPASTARWGAVGAFALLSVFAIAIARTLAAGRRPDCHCFGQLHSTPIGVGTLIRDLGLAAVALFIVVAAAHAPGPGALSWLGGLNGNGIARLAAAVTILGALGLVGWFCLELLRQNGRILARVESLEQRLGIAGEPVNGRSASSFPGGENGEGPGLPVGAPARGFELPTVDGERSSLRTLLDRGAPVVLVFADPGCGPCEALLPDVAQWQQRRRDEVTVALISRGTAERNVAKTREHGLREVLLQTDREVAEAYQAQGTPTAVAIGVDGRIISRVVGGARAVSDLVQSVSQFGLEVVRSPRDGGQIPSRSTEQPRLAIGDAAPVGGPAVLDVLSAESAQDDRPVRAQVGSR